MNIHATYNMNCSHRNMYRGLMKGGAVQSEGAVGILQYNRDIQ